MLATALAVVLGTFSTDARLLEPGELEVFAQTTPPLLGTEAGIIEEPSAGSSPNARRLAELRAQPEPSLLGPIATLASGVGLVVVGGVFLYLGAVIGLSSLTFIGSGSMMGITAAGAFVIIGVVALAPAIVLTIAGAVWLVSTVRHRKERTREIRQLERLERPAPPTEQPQPPGIPPSVLAPQPSLLLATF